MSTLSELVYDVTERALGDCTDLQRRAYELTRGFAAGGVHMPPMTLDQAAEVMHTGRKNVHLALAFARAKVAEEIAKALILHYGDLHGSDLPLAEGSATGREDYGTLASGYLHVTERVEQRIHLGPGSQAMESAAKHSDPERRRAATISTHRQYANGGCL